MARQTGKDGSDSKKTAKRRPHETGGPHQYGGNPDLVEEADEPGDRIQGSDGNPVTGKP